MLTIVCRQEAEMLMKDKEMLGTAVGALSNVAQSDAEVRACVTKADRLNLSETAANEKTAEEETEETAANEKTAEEETPTSHSVVAAAPTPTPAPTVATPTPAPTSSHQSSSPAVSNRDRLQQLKEKMWAVCRFASTTAQASGWLASTTPVPQSSATRGRRRGARIPTSEPTVGRHARDGHQSSCLIT